MVRVSFTTAISMVLPTVLFAAPPAGKATCATCHKEEARVQPKTSMGIGLELPTNQEVLKAHARLTFESNGYEYVIERKDGVSTYTVSDSVSSLALPIQFAFGVAAQTFVFEYGGHFYESLVSYYPTASGLAITMGSERVRPHTLVEAMGRATSSDEIVACFGCHSSGGVSQGKLTLDAMQPGLDCEHCHAGANAHQEAMSQAKPSAPAPKKLGEMSAEEMSNFCGGCHRTWDTVVRLKTWGEVNVRFQPYRLANSKCFLGNDRRIGCTACHNPHDNLVRDDGSYDHNCMACHAKAAVSSPSQKTCPVASAKCISCHMPKVELPGSHSLFTDHQIRVVHSGDPYPN